MVGKISKVLKNKKAFLGLTDACAIKSHYYKMITKFSVLDIKNHLPIFATTQIFLLKVIFHRKTVKLAD